MAPGADFRAVRRGGVLRWSILKKPVRGIECRHSAKLIDELPMAYKDIDELMANSKDLVKVVEHTLRQVVNVKGD
jgi:tRNA-splicing ligase RtcB